MEQASPSIYPPKVVETGDGPNVLLKTYAHAFDKRKREAVDALGEARKAARTAG